MKLGSTNQSLGIEDKTQIHWSLYEYTFYKPLCKCDQLAS